MAKRDKLNAEYENTIIILMISGSEINLEDSQFTGHIITAWNPYSVFTNEIQNEMANDLLASELKLAGFSSFDATGSNDDGTWVEKSFAVIGLSDLKAVEIAHRYGQNAIFKVTKGVKSVIWCD